MTPSDNPACESFKFERKDYSGFGMCGGYLASLDDTLRNKRAL